MKLSVIIPAHNESHNIQNALEKISSHLDAKKYNYEILVSEDGSTDDTFKIASDFSKRNSKVKVIHSRKRLGKGGGIIQGFKKAKGDIIAFIDADLSSGTSELEKVIGAVRRGSDLAIASRHMPQSKITTDRPFFRRIAARGMNLLVNAMFDFSIVDTQCGLKAISKDALDKILPKISHTGFEFDVEFILRAKQAGLKIAEVPITWGHRQETAKISGIPIKTIYKTGSGLFSLWLRDSFTKCDLLFLLFLLLFIGSASFVIGKTIDPDEGTHLTITAFFFNFVHDYFGHPTLSFSKIYNYAIAYLVRYPKLSLYYPPGFYFTAALFSKIFGLSIITAAVTGLLFAVLTILLVYYIGRKFVDKKVGIVAALMFAIIPTVFYLSVRAMLDISYLFFFLLSLVFYLFAMRSGKNRYFILAAIIFGLGFLFKQNIIILAPVILLYSLAADRKHLKKIFLSFLIAAVIMTPYLIFLYKSGLLAVLLKSSVRATGFDLNSPQFNTLAGWLFYPQQIAAIYLSYPVTAAALIALACYSLKKEKYWKLLLVWFLTIYLIFVLIPNKQGRYFLPAIPALLFPLAFYITRLSRNLVAASLIATVALILYTAYLILPSGFYYTTDYATIASVTLRQDGNVLLLDEQQPWFYSSAFTFEMIRQDISKSHTVLRPCALDGKSMTDLISENGVRYLISTNASALPNVTRTFTDKNISVYLYENTNYYPQKEDCNYICITNQWICTQYSNPADALK